MKIPFTNIEIARRQETNAPSPYVYKRKGSYRILGDKRDQNYSVNTETFYNVYKQNGDVWACAREWAENVGAGGWELVNSNDPEAPVSDADYMKVETILKQSGGFDRVKGDIVRDLAICGNAYLAKTSNKAGGLYALERIDPRTLVVISTEHGRVIAYIQKIPGEGTVTFQPEEVVHLRGQTDFDNPLLGMSPMQSIILEVLTDVEASKTNHSFFKNNAVPAAQYIMDDSLSNEAMDEAVDFIVDQLKGSENAHKAMAMQGVKDIKVMSQTNKDMEFLEGRKFNTEKVCSAYGVPKFVLGYTESVNNNNGTELLKKFYSGTIAPKEAYIEDVFNMHVIPEILGDSAVVFRFLPQIFDEQKDLEERALRELAMGAITRRQYKTKTGQEITLEDERTDNFDKYIILQGMGATLLEDVGLSFEPLAIDGETE